tara:strand:+ start:23 stop:202 length:180 start_codon:yes stop_codon:yes gene_type:complete
MKKKPKWICVKCGKSTTEPQFKPLSVYEVVKGGLVRDVITRWMRHPMCKKCYKDWNEQN